MLRPCLPLSLLALLSLAACSRPSSDTSTSQASPAASAVGAVAASNVAPPAVAPAAPSAAATPNPAADAAIPKTVKGSCSFMGVSCSDYQGDASPAPLKEMCLKYSGKWSDGPCPRAGIQGVCTKLEPPFRNVTYTYPPGTAATSKKACDNTPGGVFSEK